MARRLSSFLIRFWCTSRTQRIEIEHIQSGEKGLVTSVADAVDWINVRACDAPPREPEHTDQLPDSEMEETEES
jgi:hypothetical protein